MFRLFQLYRGVSVPPRSCLLWHPGTTGSGGRFPALALVPVMETYWRPRPQVRSVAQLGSAPGLGPGGRWFESSRSDQNNAEGFQHSRSPFFLPVVLPFAAFGLLPRISTSPVSRRVPIPAAPLPSPAPPRTHLPLFPLLQGTSRLSSKQSLFRPVAPPMLLGTTRNRRFGICVLT